MSRKYIEPDLIDPNVNNKIINLFRPPNSDYWASVKNLAKYIYKEYILPNWFPLTILFFVIIYLIYRYRTVNTVSYVPNNNPVKDLFFSDYYMKKDILEENRAIGLNKKKYVYPIYPINIGSLEPPATKDN